MIKVTFAEEEKTVHDIAQMLNGLKYARAKKILDEAHERILGALKISLSAYEQRPSDSGKVEHTDRDNVNDELQEICRPVVEYIQKKYGSPHHRIIIDWSSAMVVEDLHGVGFNPPD